MRATEIATLSLLLTAPLAVACGEEQVAPEEVLRPVRTHTVTAAGISAPRTLAGVARSGVESRLSFRVPGTVRQVRVALGDRVRRGQVLARLDPTDYELKVQEAEAALAQGQAGLRRAQADYDRVRGLYENNNASKSELDAARAAAESAQALVESGEKRLEQARQQLDYTVLAAPVEGAIAKVDIEVNENVASGQAVFLLTAGALPEVEVAVPEVMISAVAVGQPVDVRFDALPGQTFEAEIREVGVAVTGAASTFAVKARLLRPEPRIRSGMAAEVTFLIKEEDSGEGILVPLVAVGEDRDGRFVFVLEPTGGGEGVVRRRPVTVGHPPGRLEAIEILDGLRAGEVVVTAGVRRLADGMLVRVLGEGSEGT